MNHINRIPPKVLSQELTYILTSTGFWSRLWRSARAAWRCAQIAARAKTSPR